MFTLKTLLETKPKFYLSTNIDKFKLATKTNHSLTLKKLTIKLIQISFCYMYLHIKISPLQAW